MRPSPRRKPGQPGSRSTRMAALAIMVVVINVLVLAMAGGTLYQSWLLCHQRASAAAQNLALALEREIEGEVGQIDTTLLWTKEAIEAQAIGKPGLDAFIARQAARVPYLDGIQVVDADGVFTHGIGVVRGRVVSIKDRDYFQKLRDDTTGPLVVSRPLLGRLTQEWAVIMGRRLVGPGGAFAGVVLANVNLTRFTHTLSSLNVDANGIVVLRGGDLSSIARFPSLPGSAFNQTARTASPELEAEVRAGRTEGIYFSTLNNQRIPRMTAFRKVPGYPFYVVVGLAAKDYLAVWRKEALQAAGFSAAFLLLTVMSARHLRATWERDQKIQTRFLLERERRRNERAMRDLEAQFQQAQKMESLGVLAGGVAHDMNNVLGAILAVASTHIGSQPPGSPLHHALETICKATERGGRMVKGLLGFARQTPTEERVLDMNALLGDQVALLERTTLAKVHLQLDLEAGLSPIRGDGGALAHAIMNLCVNAVDAMPENGTLTLRTRNLDGDRIEVAVEDTGAGMPREVLEKALDPFFTTKAVGKGTGLGLAMVYSTVKAHRGQMTLQSEPGRGTRVKLVFPACEPEIATPEAGPGSPAGTSGGALDVLLVDDDELIQSSIQAVLEILGHRVDPAWSGEEALAKLEAGSRPDLIILDVNMPGLGGAGTLPRLRAMRPAVPVLLATGRIDQTALTLVSDHPGVTLLAKPFGLRELQKHLDDLRRVEGEKT